MLNYKQTKIKDKKTGKVIGTVPEDYVIEKC